MVHRSLLRSHGKFPCAGDGEALAFCWPVAAEMANLFGISLQEAAARSEPALVNRFAGNATSGRVPDGPGATSDHQDAAATAALTRLNRRNWYEARAMNKTSPDRTPSTMDVGVTRPASCRARAMPVPATMQFTVKIAEDVVNTTARRDDRVPISSSSWTAVRSVGCGKK